MGAAVKTIRKHAFYKTKLTGLDLPGAASLESITDFAFSQTDITGTTCTSKINYRLRVPMPPLRGGPW